MLAFSLAKVRRLATREPGTAAQHATGCSLPERTQNPLPVL
jgi:hypothetical protein